MENFAINVELLAVISLLLFQYYFPYLCKNNYSRRCNALGFVCVSVSSQKNSLTCRSVNISLSFLSNISIQGIMAASVLVDLYALRTQFYRGPARRIKTARLIGL